MNGQLPHIDGFVKFCQFLHPIVVFSIFLRTFAIQSSIRGSLLLLPTDLFLTEKAPSAADNSSGRRS